MLEGFTPFPQDVAERYRREGYWQPDTLGALLRRWSAQHGERVAIVDGEQRLSYAELDRLVDRLAYRLLERGIGTGDRVVLHLPNTWEFPVLALALLRIGALAVFALPDHREHEIRHFVDFAGAVAYAIPSAYRDFDYQALARKLVASSASLRDVLVAGEVVEPDFVGLRRLLEEDIDDGEARAAVEQHEPEPEDIAFFLLSGGTTGLPKFIPRTHADYAYNLAASAELCGFDERTVYLVALPVAHNFPWGCPGLLGALHAGGRAVLTRDPNPAAALPLVKSEGATATALVPALAIRWLDAAGEAGCDLSSLRLLQVGGARLNPAAARRVRPILGCSLQQVFGMAEGLLNYTRLGDPDDIVIHTQGRPLSPADEVRIVDSDETPVADGQAGQLLTRGPYTIRGYYNAPEENAASFTADGFYRTGDVVRRDAAGNLTVEGRVKDFINRGGEKISAEEVEGHVAAHPSVANVAAVAMPDAEMNERVCAYVVLRPGAELDLPGLRTFLQERGLARFKIPDRLELVDEFPYTNVGKVSKKTLREDIATKLAAGTQPA